MNTQPEALRIADTLELLWMDGHTPRKAATELRRLHEANQELVEALKRLIAYDNGVDDMFFAKAVLAKSRGKE